VIYAARARVPAVLCRSSCLLALGFLCSVHRTLLAAGTQGVLDAQGLCACSLMREPFLLVLNLESQHLAIFYLVASSRAVRSKSNLSNAAEKVRHIRKVCLWDAVPSPIKFFPLHYVTRIRGFVVAFTCPYSITPAEMLPERPSSWKSFRLQTVMSTEMTGRVDAWRMC
jgi:hypothetical protein